MPHFVAFCQELFCHILLTFNRGYDILSSIIYKGNMNFSDNIKKIRKELNLTQDEFAAKLNLTRQAVGMWESGERTPKLDEIQRIAKALKITISRLITNHDNNDIEITKDAIIVKGQKIDISELNATDVDGIIEYISQVKSERGVLPTTPPPKMKDNAKKILMIDDEQELCEMLYSFLIPHGYKVFLAFNGQMGLEYFEEIKPDIVFLDLKMPDIDGVEVLKIIRKVSDVPVVIITGHPEEVPDIHLADLKIEGFIEKPIGMAVVLNTLKQVLG